MLLHPGEKVTTIFHRRETFSIVIIKIIQMTVDFGLLNQEQKKATMKTGIYWSET